MKRRIVKYNHFVNYFFGLLTAMLFWPKMYNKKKFDHPVIFICNHTGHIDGALINTALWPAVIHSLAAKDRFEQALTGWFLRATNCIPIDRKTSTTKWVETAITVLNEDKDNIVIYPEGRLGFHRRMIPFHPGVIMLATVANVPIVPLIHDGPARIFHRNNLIMGDPVKLPTPSEGMTSEYIVQQTELLQTVMNDLMNELIEIVDKK